jgi:hypothetical protein
LSATAVGIKADNDSRPQTANAPDPPILCIRSGLLHLEVKNRILDANSGSRIAKGDALEAAHQWCMREYTVETAEILVGAEQRTCRVATNRRPQAQIETANCTNLQQILVCDEIDLRFLDAESWTKFPQGSLSKRCSFVNPCVCANQEEPRAFGATGRMLGSLSRANGKQLLRGECRIYCGTLCVQFPTCILF